MSPTLADFLTTQHSRRFFEIMSIQSRKARDLCKVSVKAKLFLAFLFCAVLISGCGPPNQVNTPADINGKIIGGMAGTPSVRLADDYGTPVAYTSEEQMMADLRSGVIDCVIMESTTAQELVSNTSGVRILVEPLTEYELRFAVPRENNALLKAVDTALDTLTRNGTLRGLYSKYFAGRNYNYVSPELEEPYDRTLTVALPPDSPPLSYKDPEGRFIGMDVEVAKALGDVLGVEIIALEYDPWELATAVWHGRADLALGWHPGEGEDIVSMSEPYATVVQVIIVRR